MQLHVLGGQTVGEVPGLGLLGVLGIAVAHHTVLVSLAGEEDAPVSALGDVAGPHHLPELLALAQLGLEHALLVVVHHVLGDLGDLVGVLTLALDALLHDGPHIQVVLPLLLLHFKTITFLPYKFVL